MRSRLFLFVLPLSNLLLSTVGASAWLRSQRTLPFFERPPPLPSLNCRMPLTALQRAIQPRALSLSARDVACINLCAAELMRCIA